MPAERAPGELTRTGAAVRGAIIGTGFSAVLVGTAAAVTVVGDHAPPELRGGYELAARWAFGTLSACIATCVAAAIYQIVWTPARRSGWAGREGGRVLLCSAATFIISSTAGLAIRTVDTITSGIDLDTLGRPAPMWLIAAIGPAVFAWSFSRTRRRTRRRRDPEVPASSQRS